MSVDKEIVISMFLGLRDIFVNNFRQGLIARQKTNGMDHFGIGFSLVLQILGTTVMNVVLLGDARRLRPFSTLVARPRPRQVSKTWLKLFACPHPTVVVSSARCPSPCCRFLGVHGCEETSCCRNLADVGIFSFGQSSHQGKVSTVPLFGGPLP